MELADSPPQIGAMNLTASLPWILWITSASCSAQTLVIRLYDYADLSAKQTVRLTETTGLALAGSGIPIAWVHCRGALVVAPGTTCPTELLANEIVVRLVPDGPPTSNGDRTQHLSHTIADADGGHYASVFVPAVRAQAAEFGMGFDLLMAYAVAHEVGHCLLGPGHSSTGLMRAAWNRKDAEEMSRLSLHLTKQEARKTVARLALAQPAVKR
jgi:hypothetical protein